jgi:hypothetical protein
LRASIVPEVVIRTNVVQGIVGSNLEYAPHMEFGTRPFRPPWRPLYEWALRKTKGDTKAAGALAAGAILAIQARGIQAKRYLQRAVESNARRVYKIIGSAVRSIIRK